jgi:hypothetical protein
LVPIAKCRDWDLLLHEREDVKKPGRTRENIQDDGEKHAIKYEHTVDVVIKDYSEYRLITHNPR